MSKNKYAVEPIKWVEGKTPLQPGKTFIMPGKVLVECGYRVDSDGFLIGNTFEYLVTPGGGSWKIHQNKISAPNDERSVATKSNCKKTAK